MCLGSETAISVVPKSGFREPEVVGRPGAGAGAEPNAVLGVNIESVGLIPMDVDDVQHDDTDVIMAELEPETEQGTVALPVKKSGECIDLTEEVPPQASSAGEQEKEKGRGRGKGRAPGAARKPKLPKQDISLTLLHGDMMMLVGDDFEVSCFFVCSGEVLINFFLRGGVVVFGQAHGDGYLYVGL